MATGIYAGVKQDTQKVVGDIIPKTWTVVSETSSGSEYIASDGTTITSKPDSNSNYKLPKAFDSLDTSYWQTATTTKSAEVTLKFTTRRKITKMSLIASAVTVANLDSITIQGSNNNSDWVELYKTTASLSNLTVVDLKNVDFYQYYKLAFSNSGYSYVRVYQWEVSEYIEEGITKEVACKVKRAYVDVDNIERKVKKGYVGVNEVARLFFVSQKELAYYGTLENMFTARSYGAGASIGNYALIAGGLKSGTYIATVEAYDKNLVKRQPNSLQTSRDKLAGASNANYAFFTGGELSSGSPTNYVDIYSKNLVKSGTLDNLTKNRDALAGASAGENYAVFAGGLNSSNAGVTDVDAYDLNCARSTPSALSSQAGNQAGASVGEYALFTAKNEINAYSSNLTKSTIAIYQYRTNLTGASNGAYAIFAGGRYDGSKVGHVDAYNANLVRTIPEALSQRRQDLAGAGVDGFAVFAGGSDYGAAVDIYDTYLIRSTSTLTVERGGGVIGVSNGKYAIFAGGKSDTAIEVFQSL